MQRERSGVEAGDRGLAGKPLSIASERADRRWHRSLALGFLAAGLIHLLLLLISRGTTIPPMPLDDSAAGPPMGDVRAAAGGGDGLTMVEVRPEAERTEEEVPEPVPVPVPVPAEVEVEPETPREERTRAETPSVLGTTRPGRGGQEGPETGPGTETGTGRGGGGTGEEGEPSAITPPTPRGMILPPPDRPRSVRGMEVTVWVFVNERGRVVADSTRLDPPTPDARYNTRLRRSASDWVFEPARQGGRPVAAWYPYQIIL